jgi:hypothetical protein
MQMNNEYVNNVATHHSMIIPVMEWLGAVFGLLGSFMLAANVTGISEWGFIAYFLSNLCWIGFALFLRAYGMLLMQLGFIVSSLIGMYRWLI